MSTLVLLGCFQGVRSTAPGRWIARCPAHEDRSPSLSIRELDDGRILLHDFGGCAAADVLAAVGLTLADLFPGCPQEHQRRGQAPRIPAADVLTAVDHEAHVVAVIAADIFEHREVDAPTWERLSVAVRRIGDARVMVAPEKIKVFA